MSSIILKKKYKYLWLILRSFLYYYCDTNIFGKIMVIIITYEVVVFIPKIHSPHTDKHCHDCNPLFLLHVTRYVLVLSAFCDIGVSRLGIFQQYLLLLERKGVVFLLLLLLTESCRCIPIPIPIRIPVDDDNSSSSSSQEESDRCFSAVAPFWFCIVGTVKTNPRRIYLVVWVCCCRKRS